MNNIFCGLCDIQSGVIERGSLWTLVLNRNQTLLGRCYFALNRHETDVTNLTDDEQLALFDGFRRAKASLDQLLQPDHYNYVLLMNIEPHVHGHIIPRYSEGRDYGGHSFADREYGGHYDPGTEQFLPEDSFDRLAAAIGELLEKGNR